MGVKITELLPRKEIAIQDLHGKTLAVDASLFLYQFVTSIRQRDGSLLTDSKGNVTSHLVGLFSRTAKLVSSGIKPVYVFDGKPPELKKAEQARRREAKEDAETKYKIAVEKEDVEEMRKYASRTSKLSKEMIQEAKDLLTYMGLPVVQAPGEAEAQAAFMVKKGDAYSVASQDSDSLVFGAPRLLRNLSAYGKRKVANKLAFETVQLELIELSESLSKLNLSQEQFVNLCMLIGTDYNVGGIKGIGPKNALKLVTEYSSSDLFAHVKWEEHCSTPWKDIQQLFFKPTVREEYSLESPAPQWDKMHELLVEQHDFSVERVNKTIEQLKGQKEKRSQKTLGDF